MIQIMVVVLLLAGLGWWWSGPSSDELVLYAARCADGISILPPTLAMRTETFERDFEKYQQDRANCVILPANRTVYKLNNARAEVYYIGLSGPRRLVDCAIFSRTDWACSYPDGSGRVVVMDGLGAIHADDVNRAGAFLGFYLRRWQWWGATLWWWVGRPQGAWLIPEQHEYF